jgi:hypothetical protein
LLCVKIEHFYTLLESAAGNNCTLINIILGYRVVTIVNVRMDDDGDDDNYIVVYLLILDMV